MESIGTRIARSRKDRGLTQKALADKIGVNHATVAKWEIGMVRPARYLPELCAALDVTVKWIIEGGAEKPQEILFEKGGLPTLVELAYLRASTFDTFLKDRLAAKKSSDKDAVRQFAEEHSQGLNYMASLLSDLAKTMRASFDNPPPGQWSYGIPDSVKWGLQRVAESSLKHSKSLVEILGRLGAARHELQWLEEHQQGLMDFAARAKYLATSIPTVKLPENPFA